MFRTIELGRRCSRCCYVSQPADRCRHHLDAASLPPRRLVDHRPPPTQSQPLPRPSPRAPSPPHPPRRPLSQPRSTPRRERRYLATEASPTAARMIPRSTLACETERPQSLDFRASQSARPRRPSPHRPRVAGSKYRSSFKKKKKLKRSKSHCRPLSKSISRRPAAVCVSCVSEGCSAGARRGARRSGAVVSTRGRARAPWRDAPSVSGRAGRLGQYHRHSGCLHGGLNTRCRL